MVRGARSGVLAASFKQTRHTVHDWRRRFGLKGSLLLLLLRILVGLCYVTSSNCDWKERMPRGTNSLRIAPSRPPQLGHCDLEETCDWSWFQNQTAGFKKIAPASMRNKNGPVVDASNSTKGKAHSARCFVSSTRNQAPSTFDQFPCKINLAVTRQLQTVWVSSFHRSIAHTYVHALPRPQLHKSPNTCL